MLRLGVVGAGIMGANHARVAMGLRDATVAAVVDPDSDRAKALAGAVGSRAASTVEEILDDIDAAVVAVPNHLHRRVAGDLIEAGKHVLVEKPIASTVEDGVALVTAAARNGAVLMVGHVERFNPAVIGLEQSLTEIVHIDVSRVSPYTGRIVDDVVLDLMIHDLDIALSVVDSPVVGVSTVRRRVRSESDDLVCALVTFANGVTANFTASRVGQNKIREWRVTQADSFVTLDLVRQDITVMRVDYSEFLSEDGPRYRQSGVIEIPFLDRRGEPLYLELVEFVDSIVEGRRPRVDGEAGVAALQLALEIAAS